MSSIWAIVPLSISVCRITSLPVLAGALVPDCRAYHGGGSLACRGDAAMTKKKPRPIGRTPTKREELCATMHTFLNQHPGASLQQLRLMVGMAAKYILPRAAWDFQGPLSPIVRFGISLETHPTVQSILAGFYGINSTQMMQGGLLPATLRAMAHYDDALRSPKCRPKIRKKRLTRYRKDMLHVFSALRLMSSLEADAPAGIRYSIESIRRHFLT